MAVLARGVDYVFSRPDVTCLRTNGYTFACRYVWSGQNPPSAKLLQKAEADRLKAAGLRVVSNFESWTDRALDGYEAGRADARVAMANTMNAGGPANAVVYFSIDFNATASQLSGSVAAYFRGAVTELGLPRVGVYGGYRHVKYIHENWLASWVWQTYAWSGGLWYPQANIRQVRNGVTLCGGTLDLNEQHTPNIGAWGESSDPMFSDLDLF
jgi:hypothetical protein